MDTRHGPGLREQLEEIIESAQRAGVVIYTIDAKGLTANMLDDEQRRVRSQRTNGAVQMLRDGRVVQESRSKVSDAGTDPDRIFFGRQLALQSLSPDGTIS